ncbi:Devancosaminyl-vancomycin vancosaminetransferase [Dickeya dianthicola]|uniref:Glycosyltransferase n=1 Tax=Dickeya dianthicola TaxID=204039 RepID=A0AAP2D189_9GAMM|nr:nucleotide disphospho-sugar-binding domain-containing protein [Dickeya dianthicola]ATO33813.1 RhlB, TDP-rhamnosyltransferase 1 [Dickeya dianthicola RNS04.9]AYC19741.1 Devancosaminyl-vancomycin vancosaminetransferase [Dickeya dianthicola]MBI0438872.1 glycosyltransferase [Dickeya dianthicola]MBI0449259.1 glycosyltransferase [Dickeya dianthicola]MBI0453669.1 glycosyltransferase [Dickeya dianthicola]
MRVFLSTLGSAGDVYPFIRIGEALKNAGLDVYLCTNPYFEQTAKERGLNFIPVGTSEDYLRTVNSQRLWHQQSAFNEMVKFMNAQQQPAYDALVPRVDRSSVILTSLWSFTAKMLSETRGCCVIPVRVTPSTFISSYDPPHHRQLLWVRRLPMRIRRLSLYLVEKYLVDRQLAPFINAFRIQLGLPPIERVLTSWTHRTDAALLCLFPEWFSSPLPDWPDHVRQVGFPLFNLLDNQQDDDLAQFIARERTVIFMPSWALSTKRSLAISLVEKIRQRGYQCLIVGKPYHELADDTGVRAEGHINLGQYLHRCAAIIHHGGIGTMAQSFAAGIPQLVIPSAFDQFDNARRVTAMKCGEWLPESDIDKLGDKLHRLLSDADIAEHCQRIRQQFPSEQAVGEHIVDTVREAYARHMAKVDGEHAVIHPD